MEQMSYIFFLYAFLKDLREKDGIPDLRRAARFRFANVTLPEVGRSSSRVGLLISFVRIGLSDFKSLSFN